MSVGRVSLSDGSVQNPRLRPVQNPKTHPNIPGCVLVTTSKALLTRSDALVPSN